MDNFFKFLSIILTALLIGAVLLYFTADITAWLYQPTDNISVIGIISIIAAVVLFILINKLNSIYDLIIHINFNEEEDEYEGDQY